MNRTPPSVPWTFILILVNAAFWLIFGILVALGAVRPISASGVLQGVTATLAMGTSLALICTVVLLCTKAIRFLPALALLTLIAVLSITDQVRLPDLLTFAASLAAFALLLKDRAWFLARGRLPGEDRAA